MILTTYFNEFSPHAAQWLRNLYPDSVVDTQDITKGIKYRVELFNRCHFFAGVGGWEEALNLAGWPEDMPVWTGSCPCQPFSDLGKRRAERDERHIWPDWFRLIDKYRPNIIFGEQVANSLAQSWLDRIQTQLEGADYWTFAASLNSAYVGSPTIRQRLFWVARTNSNFGNKQTIQTEKTRFDINGTIEQFMETMSRQWYSDGIGFEQYPDGYWRRSQSGVPVLVDGLSYQMANGSAGVGGNVTAINHGFGNAINPRLAAVFIRSVMEMLNETHGG